MLLPDIQFSLFSTRNIELWLNGITRLVLAEAILVTSGSGHIARARSSRFLLNAAGISRAHGRTRLHPSGSLSDYDEQGPPAHHAGHTAWERKTLSSATEMWRLFVTVE